MFCKKCGKQIADGSKFCPECGASFESNNAVSPANGAVPPANGAVPPANGAVPPANGPVYIVGAAPQPAKKHGCLKTFLIILAVIVIISFIGSKCSSSNGSSEEETTTEVIPTEMLKVTVDELEEALDNNAAAAKDTYYEKYVEITGELSNIDSDLKYISLQTEGFKGIQCYIKNPETKEVVKTLKREQKIVVKGKITRVGEVLGYSLDIVEIIPQQTGVLNNNVKDMNQGGNNAENMLKVSVDELFEALDNNAAAAKETYKGKYVEIKGQLGTIDSDLKYISLRTGEPAGLLCDIKNSETKEVVKTLKKDQLIVVKGKIKDVGEIMGYSLDIIEIIPQ